MKSLITVFMVLALVPLTGQDLGILPSPQAISYLQALPFEVGALEFSAEADYEDPRARLGQQMIGEACRDWQGLSTDAAETLPVQVRIGDPTTDEIPETVRWKQRSEAYLIRIDDRGILICATDPAGLLYAAFTFRQLLAMRTVLPAVAIYDYPDFPYRGIMDDISRGPIPNLAFMKKQVEKFASLKLNVFSFYIEHVLRTERHHIYSPDDGLTLDELSELATYAAQFNIQLMGSFQSLGHFRNILRHPDYEKLGIGDRMLDPLNLESQDFLREIYSELIPVFNHEIFNINCDEAYDLRRGEALRILADSIGEGQIYLNHVKPLIEYVARSGKRPAMWGDLLLKHPEILPQIPKETVVFTWTYGREQDYSYWIDPLVEHGLSFVVCPGVLNSYKLWPDLFLARDNIRALCQEGFEKGASGVLTTVWDDGGRHFFETDWLGIAYAAEYSWNTSAQTDREVAKKYSRVCHRDTSALFHKFLMALSQLQEIEQLSQLDNRLLNICYRHGDEVAFIDTTHFHAIQSKLSKARRILDRLIKHVATLAPESLHEMEVWSLKLQEMQAAVTTPLVLLRHREILADGARSPARQQWQKELQKEKVKWQRLRQRFSHLWFYENRTPWYDDAVELYDCKIDALEAIRSMYGLKEEQVPDGKSKDAAPAFQIAPGLPMPYWLGAGPFPADDASGIDVDFFAAEMGEQQTRPGAIDYFLHPSGHHQGWNKIITTRSAQMELTDFYTADPYDVAYACCQVMCTEPVTIEAQLICDSPYRIFLNGHRLSPDPATNRLVLDLNKGRNDLMIKIAMTPTGDWDFSLFLLHEIFQHKYRYFVR